MACRPVINETELSKRDSIIRKMAEEIRLLREELAAEREKKTIRPQGFPRQVNLSRTTRRRARP